ncbi:Peptidyl-prolyl cis-trans isomerase PpiD [hydrothermal vent metagenome]|uniref:Periplasmic chaperone PpiD n=1 Tax=hydrothermal vent metagenome TaxID=652676 RepID=A0A3B0WLJ4_9ZZZZ
MLQAINDRIKGWLGIAIVILIGLPFALWGIQSYFDDAGPRYAAKVNGQEITANQFERTVSIQRQALLRQYGSELPIEEKELREKTLTQLINQRLLENVSFEKGYRVSDAVLSARIKQMFTVDGVFDRMRFEANANAMNMSIPMFENTLRNELRTKQMQAALANTSFATRHELNTLASLNEQTRDISVLTFNVDHFSTASEPSSEDLQQYYNENLSRFMMPETVTIDYVEIKSEDLAETITVDEEQIKLMYDDYVTSIKDREERKARHLLLTVAADAKEEDKISARVKIESLKKKIDEGADFAQLAKENSQDTGSAVEGGDLGWVALGEMVKPFEKALFALDKGAVSNIVESQFGYHLIKLDDIRSEEVEPLGIKRYSLEEDIKADSVASMFYDRSERLASIAYENPDSLDLVVEELGLKVNTSKSFSRTKGEDVAGEEKVRNIAFSALVLQDGANSDIIEISPSHIIVLRINEHNPSKAIPLELVSSKIENIVKIKRGHEQTKTAALGVKTKIEAGESVDSVKADGISVDVIADLGRNDRLKVSDSSILYSAFDLVKSESGSPSVNVVDLVSGDVVLVVLDKVNPAENISQDKLDLVKNQYLRENSVRDFSNALLSIKENANIDKNTNIINR